MKTIACVIFVLLVAFSDSGYGSESPKFLWIEPGDSYIALFGKSWLPVFQENSNLQLLDKRGKLNLNPEKLIVGSKLIIPNGTILTERALKRMNKYETFIKEAKLTLNKAERFAAIIDKCESKPCRQAMYFLGQAQKSAKENPTYGYANVLEATKLSQKALSCFIVATEAQQAKINIKKINKQLETEKNDTRRQINKQRMQHKIFIGIVSSKALGSILFIRHKAKTTRAWHNQQQDRLKSIEGSLS